MEFRIGIHLGDVVEESDGDLMGDGVNIAARLEGVAAPGGICLSEDAYRQVRDRLKEDFVDLGDRTLKNIARPVRLYSVKSGSGFRRPRRKPRLRKSPARHASPSWSCPLRISAAILSRTTSSTA
jgi:adenylate cyclase